MWPLKVPKNMKLPVLVWLGDGQKLLMNDRNDSTGLVLEYHQSFEPIQTSKFGKNILTSTIILNSQ